MELLPEDNESRPPTWTLIRDIAVLQVKLVVDGLRDLILVPASLVAGIISLGKTKDGVPGTEFYALVGVGRQSERWINLFGALKHGPPPDEQEVLPGDTSIDDLVARIENYVVEEYRSGGVTGQAKKRIDDALDAIQRNTRKDQQS